MIKSALLIVCNGMPFIIPQLQNIYDHVDEIVIMEGPDKYYQQVIGSFRSTDGTIDMIRRFPDPKKKITLVEINADKNCMVAVGAKLCRGNIYCVDVDEFMLPSTINLAFSLLDQVDEVAIPQRIYYKWPHVHVKTNRPNNIILEPSRFYRNMVKDGIFPSHIPSNGSFIFRHGGLERIELNRYVLPEEHYACHYASIYYEQIRDKMTYYGLRDGIPFEVRDQRILEFVNLKYSDVKKETATCCYGPLVIDPNPRNFNIPNRALLV